MWLATGVHWADFGDRAVLLDLRADRYWLLGARHAALLAALAQDRDIRGSEAPSIDALVRAGLLDPMIKAPNRTLAAPSPLDSALEAAPETVAGIGWRQVAVASLEAVGRLRWTRLVAALGWAVRERAGLAAPEGPAPAPVRAAAQRFDRLRAGLPLARVCLRDSLALVVLLARVGHGCQLVFGVRLDPFEAHCWVQSGSTLLSDRLDHVRQMQPILTL